MDYPAAQKTGGAAAVIVRFVATGFGIGRIRNAPGTWGTLWGVLISWLLFEAGAGWFGWISTIVALHVAGLLVCRLYAQYFHTKDPGELVVDEIAAFPITMLPAAMPPSSSFTVALMIGFVFFRIFDIAKPPPIKQLEQLPGPLGVMADDTLAGMCSAACMWCLVWGKWL